MTEEALRRVCVSAAAAVVAKKSRKRQRKTWPAVVPQKCRVQGASPSRLEKKTPPPHAHPSSKGHKQVHTHLQNFFSAANNWNNINLKNVFKPD